MDQLLMNRYWVNSYFFNFTQVESLYGDEFNLAPRWHTELSDATDQISARTTATVLPVGNGEDQAFYYFLDLPKESAINVGTDWPYPDLAPGECLLTEDWKNDYGIEVGETVAMGSAVEGLWYSTWRMWSSYFSD